LPVLSLSAATMPHALCLPPASLMTAVPELIWRYFTDSNAGICLNAVCCTPATGLSALVQSPAACPAGQ
jgi:hypothetical protein